MFKAIWTSGANLLKCELRVQSWCMLTDGRQCHQVAEQQEECWPADQWFSLVDHPSRDPMLPFHWSSSHVPECQEECWARHQTLQQSPVNWGSVNMMHRMLSPADRGWQHFIASWKMITGNTPPDPVSKLNISTEKCWGSSAERWRLLELEWKE